jgi:hypothetical protein
MGHCYLSSVFSYSLLAYVFGIVNFILSYCQSHFLSDVSIIIFVMNIKTKYNTIPDYTILSYPEDGGGGSLETWVDFYHYTASLPRGQYSSCCNSFCQCNAAL